MLSVTVHIDIVEAIKVPCNCEFMRLSQFRVPIYARYAQMSALDIFVALPRLTPEMGVNVVADGVYDGKKGRVGREVNVLATLADNDYMGRVRNRCQVVKAPSPRKADEIRVWVRRDDWEKVWSKVARISVRCQTAVLHVHQPFFCAARPIDACVAWAAENLEVADVRLTAQKTRQRFRPR